MDTRSNYPQSVRLFADTLARVDAYVAASGMAESTFGKVAVGDDGFVSRLREGRVTFRIAQRALDYIAAQDAPPADEAAE